MSSQADTTERLTTLRNHLASHSLSAYIIPSEDAHQSEYLAPCDARRAYISNFTGSAGLVIVTPKLATLFTDGRYHLQASQQLDSNWTLMKSGLPDVPSWQDWLLSISGKGDRVGIDPTLITSPEARSLQASLAVVGAELTPIQENLVDASWPNRPSRPTHPIFPLDVAYTGKPYQEKIHSIRQDLANRGLHAVVLSALDEVAWTLNLRGSDIPYNPVFFAYLYIPASDASESADEVVTLFIHPSKISDDVRAHLDAGSIRIEPYDHLLTPHLSSRASLLASRKVLLTTRTSWALEHALGHENTQFERSPILMPKAIKNDIEQEGMRQAHLRDAAALCEYFGWLSRRLSQTPSLDEVDGADRLEAFRAAQDHFKGLSFDTISGVGPNAAIIHYKPMKGHCSPIPSDAIYLCDSGGQYLDGTTDVTRTLHFGTPTDRERRCFTRVLQGHISLDRAIFPPGTTGYSLDVLARAPLWKDGLDYRHGTGHGVGSFLNVHEGPQGIGFRPSLNEVALLPGMSVTNEPGYYEDGAFGIRIESVLLVQEVETPTRFGHAGQSYLGFENITWVPIQRSLILPDLLSPEEKLWVDNYNQECFRRVSPLLPKDSPGYAYLKSETGSF
ncbi:putative aminopeptidase P, cytoplasmic [Piptocephalis cylindrospora]|uniref:Putative aminopeptidase P, cytoplasmic n=1 Tax=Piptocephalis cylindrospora TaxID=1907219 RepID=A0A4P9Y2E9_9FUNG|nr:putative aminopeptidase P, cytoplasmic [Piptocephalis cylindrospora]|eukprot:RKP12010.1 putative aminopeptidase P, cytoplasmic [Piptocephalis cylindrospora]